MMWLWLLGCFSSEPEVALSPPWNEFGFKVGDGELEELKPDELHVVYSGVMASGPAQLAHYATRLDAAGWSLDDERSGMGMTLQDRSKGDEKLTLLVSQRGKRVDVVVELE
jgi:hypothetical protein